MLLTGNLIVLHNQLNPKGVTFYSPGLRSNPGSMKSQSSTLSGLHKRWIKPFQGMDLSLVIPRVASQPWAKGFIPFRECKFLSCISSDHHRCKMMDK